MVEAKYVLTLVKRLSGVDICLKSRKPEVMMFRWVFYLLCREFTVLNTQKISSLVNQSNSQVTHAIKYAYRIYENTQAVLIYNIIYETLKSKNTDVRKESANPISFYENIDKERILMKNLCKFSKKINILGDLLKLPDAELIIFKETRIDPYLKLHKVLMKIEKYNEKKKN